MKKALLFLASAALLITGCSKDGFSFLKKSEVVDVTFTAQMDNGAETRAAADGDGVAANVNRCIAEVYYGDELFTRQYAKVTDKQCTFSISLVSSRTYSVAFWADCVEDPDGAIETDKYYDTESLKAISLKGEYAGNDDKRDAFFHCGDYTVAQAGTNFNATLKRPFAQINVITTDWNKAAKNTGLAPEKVTVKLKNPMVNFNAVTGVASQAATPTDLTYTANIYTNPAKTVSEATLSMDYIFAATTKEIIDIDWKALKTDNADVAHSFTSVPYQRNYRTNIKGALLSTSGVWNVTIDPTWLEPGKVHEVVDDVESLNEFLASSKAYGVDSLAIEVTMPDDSDDEDVTFTSNNDGQKIKLTFTGELATGKTLDFVKSSGAAGPAVVDLTAPAGTSINCDLPGTHFIINGTSYGTISGNFSVNSLIIAKGVTVATLSIGAGGLEIHGTVQAVSIPAEHGNIYVRDCEGLTQSVYDALAPYIDSDNGYAGVKKGENNWDIVAGAAPIVAQIGETKYYKLEAALDAAVANDEIAILSNCGLSSQRTLDKNLSFDLNGNKMSFSASDVRALVLSNNAEISFEDGDLEITNANSLGLFDVTSCKSLSLTSVNMSGNTSDAKGKSGFIFQGNDGDCAVTLTDCSGTTNYRIYRGQGTNSTLSVTNGEYNCAGYNVAFQDAGTATYTGVIITVDGTGTSDYQSGIYVSGKTAEINNCTISCPNSKKGAITVCMEGTATVNGGTYSGKIAVDVLYSGGVVNINGGTYTSSGETGSYSLYADSRQAGNQYVGTDKTANIIVNSGTVTGKIGIQHKAKVYVHGGTINNDATLTGEGNPIIADGGTFAFDPSAYVVIGYIAQPQGTTPETWKVIEKPATTVSDETELKNAISNASAGDKIKFGGSFTISNRLSIEKDLTFDLNGYTLTSNDNSGENILTFTGAATISNGKIEAPSSVFGQTILFAGLGSNVKLENLEIEGPGIPLWVGGTGNPGTATVKSGCKFTSTATAIPAKEDQRLVAYMAAAEVSRGATLNIEGGEFTGHYYAVVIATSGGTINISGGTFNKGKYNFSLCNDASNGQGTGTINITSTPTIHGNLSGRINTNETTPGSSSYSGHPSYYNISGGTFDSDCKILKFETGHITTSNGYSVSGPDSNKTWTLTQPSN